MEFEAALTHFLNYFNVHFIGQRKIQLKIMKLLEKVKKKIGKVFGHLLRNFIIFLARKTKGIDENIFLPPFKLQYSLILLI